MSPSHSREPAYRVRRSLKSGKGQYRAYCRKYGAMPCTAYRCNGTVGLLKRGFHRIDTGRRDDCPEASHPLVQSDQRHIEGFRRLGSTALLGPGIETWRRCTKNSFGRIRRMPSERPNPHSKFMP
jgi:hypothetical protein